jgi:hypothetical protein
VDITYIFLKCTIEEGSSIFYAKMKVYAMDDGVTVKDATNGAVFPESYNKG